MTWFVASIASVIETIDGSQSEYPVYEDFYLFEASSEQELKDKIKRQMQTINIAGECTFLGKPARQRCIGTRKIRSIYNSESGDIDNLPPADGTELSHSFYVAASLKEAENFGLGKPTFMKCVDDSEE